MLKDRVRHVRGQLCVVSRSVLLRPLVMNTELPLMNTQTRDSWSVTNKKDASVYIFVWPPLVRTKPALGSVS
eukprot:7274821-Prorocentrum_lima.AAC.1